MRPELTQSHGTLRGGVLSSLADIVCGFAGVSQCGSDMTVNVMTHMLGAVKVRDRVQAVATVERVGSRQVVVTAEFRAYRSGKEKLILLVSTTLVSLD